MDTISINKELIQLSTTRPGYSRGLSAAAAFGLTVASIVTVTVARTGSHVRATRWDLGELIWIPYNNGAIEHRIKNLG